MDRRITKGKAIDQTSPKRTGEDLADKLSSLELDYSHGQQDKIDYSNWKIQNTIRQQHNSINYVINSYEQNRKNLERRDLDKYYRARFNAIKTRREDVTKEISDLAIQKTGNSGNEARLHQNRIEASKFYQEELKKLNSDDCKLSEEYTAAKKEILNNQQDLVEKLSPAVEQLYNQDIQKLERDINKYRGYIEDCNQKINDMNALYSTYPRSPAQESLLRSLENEASAVRNNLSQYKESLSTLNDKKSKLEKDANWRENLQQEHKQELHNLVKDIVKQPRVVGKLLFEKLQQVAEQPLEELDMQKLRSSAERYLKVLKDAGEAVQSEEARQKKGKGFARYE